MIPRALLQAVPDVYALATRADASGPAPDPERARAQHAGVVHALEWLGFRTQVLPADGAGPDGVFVEDPVVVFAGRAFFTRSAHPVRALEGVRLAPALAAWGLIPIAQDAGTLDGGDVLITGTRAYVGISARTDHAGIAAFARAFPELDVRPVELPAGSLHLKCDASPLGDGRVLATRAMAERLDVPAVLVPDDEAYAANALARGDRVVIAEGFPGTASALREAGFIVHAIPTDAFRAGDGSLTCLSIRVEPTFSS